MFAENFVQYSVGYLHLSRPEAISTCGAPLKTRESKIKLTYINIIRKNIVQMYLSTDVVVLRNINNNAELYSVEQQPMKV